NLKICYNQTTGCIKWDFVNISAANINSTSNTILDPSFVSINDSDPGTIQFNRSANITLSVSSCTDPNQFTVYKKAGLPLSRDEIISGGSLYNPLLRACTSSTLFTFGVDSFSGYAAEGLGPISTCRSIYQSGYYYLTQNLNASGLSPDALACINITASNVSLDLMGYSIQDGVVRGVYVYNSAEDISDIHIYNGSISNMTYGIEISED
ncbi:MAG: hypothetical protein ACP5KJ_04295, partial [Candidatus Micrarchaeia archaeon]